MSLHCLSLANLLPLFPNPPCDRALFIPEFSRFLDRFALNREAREPLRSCHLTLRLVALRLLIAAIGGRFELLELRAPDQGRCFPRSVTIFVINLSAQMLVRTVGVKNKVILDTCSVVKRGVRIRKGFGVEREDFWSVGDEACPVVIIRKRMAYCLV